MAIKLSDQYPGRAEPPSIDYPLGAFKNRSAPQVLDGTPLDKEWANDKEGFFQALLSYRGVIPSGVPDTSLSSQYFNALAVDPTESLRGLPLKAREDEAIAGIDDTKMVTPKDVKAAILRNATAITGQYRDLRASATGKSSIISITAAELILSNATGEAAKLRDVNLTINAATVGAGGLDTGVLAASTWYNVFVISNGTDVAGLLSISSDSPALPAGYTHKAWVAAIRTDSSANKWPLGFTKADDRVSYKIDATGNVPTLPQMANITSVSLIAIAVGGFVPPSAKVIDVSAFADTNNSIGVAPNANWPSAVSGPMPQTTNAASGAYTTSTIQSSLILESGNIYSRVTGGSGSVFCIGWRE